jgi:hypothetical protein
VCRKSLKLSWVEWAQVYYHNNKTAICATIFVMCVYIALCVTWARIELRQRQQFAAMGPVQYHRYMACVNSAHADELAIHFALVRACAQEAMRYTDAL